MDTTNQNLQRTAGGPAGPAPEGMAPQRLARTIGGLYLLLGALAMFAALMFESLFVPGDAAATADNLRDSQWLFAGSLVSWLGVVVLDTVLAVAFYVLLRPVTRTGSLIVAGIRLVFAGMLGAALTNLFDAYRLVTGVGGTPHLPDEQTETLAHSALTGFDTGFEFAIALFGVHVIGLGYLLYRSRYVPPVFAVLVVATGIGYLADSLASLLVADYGGVAGAVLVAPAFVGETALAVWLLVKGIRTTRTDRLAS
jgi:hypothetical protein